MNTKHTPGPWTQGWRKLSIVAPGPKSVCVVDCPSEHPATEAEAHANARLIASAPDMLEALRGIENRLTSLIQDGDTTKVFRTRDIARAAIAKAEGGSNG